MGTRNKIHHTYRLQYTYVCTRVAGDTDFCAVELDEGRVKVQLDLGSGQASVRSPTGLVFNDLSWHQVRVCCDACGAAYVMHESEKRWQDVA